MTRPISHFLALVFIALLVAGLLFWGLDLLFIPPIVKLARQHNALAYYQGHIFITLAVLLAWFRTWVENKLLWLCLEVRRWISALLVAGAIGIDATMHIFNIPHLEGWWIPMLGGGAIATAITAWFQSWKRKS